MPLKRIHEFAILLYLTEHETITLDQAQYQLLKYLNSVDSASIVHAFNYLNAEFFDSVDTKKYPNLGSYSHENSQFCISDSFKQFLLLPQYKEWLIDSLHYGIHRYENEFGALNFGTPFLKLYQQYNMRNVALIANYDKKHSAFRGQGVLTFGNDYFLFIELHKLEDAISYKDKFISENHFQWDSPNSSKPDQGLGLRIATHQKCSINLHLFVRKFKAIDDVVQPYIYIGLADVISHTGQKPITFQMALHHEVPASIYAEFMTNTK